MLKITYIGTKDYRFDEPLTMAVSIKNEAKESKTFWISLNVRGNQGMTALVSFDSKMQGDSINTLDRESLFKLKNVPFVWSPLEKGPHLGYFTLNPGEEKTYYLLAENWLQPGTYCVNVGVICNYEMEDVHRFQGEFKVLPHEYSGYGIKEESVGSARINFLKPSRFPGGKFDNK